MFCQKSNNNRRAAIYGGCSMSFRSRCLFDEVAKPLPNPKTKQSRRLDEVVAFLRTLRKEKRKATRNTNSMATHVRTNSMATHVH
jgi:hypothetical protein